MTERKLAAMHRLYGSIPAMACKNCRHLAERSGKRTHYKCGLYGVTGSEATDWGLSWTACGMYNVPVGQWVPVIRRLPHGEDPPIEGQTTLEI